MSAPWQEIFTKIRLPVSSGCFADEAELEKWDFDCKKTILIDQWAVVQFCKFLFYKQKLLITAQESFYCQCYWINGTIHVDEGIFANKVVLRVNLEGKKTKIQSHQHVPVINNFKDGTNCTYLYFNCYNI